MDKYLLIGDPVEHSISPLIHAHFARQSGEELTYGKQQVKSEDFSQDVKELIKNGVRGMNITLPHKELAFEFADELSERAKLAGAVNTFKIKKDGVFGDNTDGIGFIRDLTYNLGFDLNNTRILLLGAGGAARGIIKPLLDTNLKSLHIANRTGSKALALKDLFNDFGKVSASGFAELNGDFDFIINATSSSVEGQLPDINSELIKPNTVCCDLMYAKEPTGFLKFCIQQGAATTVDGLGMLVEQAAESFYIWRGLRPKTGKLLAELRG